MAMICFLTVYDKYFSTSYVFLNYSFLTILMPIYFLSLFLMNF
jgi:hypothetical protein